MYVIAELDSCPKAAGGLKMDQLEKAAERTGGVCSQGPQEL